MTREEAIELLCAYGVPQDEKRFQEALDMAIEALKAEESVTLYATPKATYVRPLTEEIAIEFLQDSGWLPNHDKEIGNPSMLVRCKDCKHLDVWNLKNIYAVCSKHGITFEPFEDDTRTHFCSWGERKEP